MIDTLRHVFNFTPNINFRYRFAKSNQLRFTYNGKSAQPNMESLLPIVDNSNPLRITTGNPGLNSSFSHNLRLTHNVYNNNTQQNISTQVNFSLTQNALANCTAYNDYTGGTISPPQNINGNWSAPGTLSYSRSLQTNTFTINTFTRQNYTNSVAFLYQH